MFPLQGGSINAYASGGNTGTLLSRRVWDTGDTKAD